MRKLRYYLKKNRIFNQFVDPLIHTNKKSWFWGSLEHSRKIYSDVIIASLVINLFVLASPLFTMNVYDRVVQVPYAEFLSLYRYLEGQTPFSTQHKTKGDEFDNVLVIMDNGKWSKYNFDKLFNELGNPGSSPDSDAGILERTRKIFYVCCTRSMENLAIFFSSPSVNVLAGAKRLFGSDRIFNLDAAQ